MDTYSKTKNPASLFGYRLLFALLISFTLFGLQGCFSSGSDTADTVEDTVADDTSKNGETDAPDTSGVGAITLSGSLTTIEPGSSQDIALTAIVMDGNRVALADQSVSFKSNSGSVVVLNDTTDESGKSLATLSVGSMKEGDSVTIDVSSGSQTAQLVLYASASTDTSITGSTEFDTKVDLYADSLTLPTGSSGAVEIMAFVRNSNNAVLENEEIVFTTNYGSLSADKVMTNASGYSTTLLSSPHEHKTGEVVTVTAKHVNCPSYGDDAAQCNKTIQLTTKGANLDIDGPDSTVGDGQIVTLNITLKDGTGSPMADQVVDVFINDTQVYDKDIETDEETIYEKDASCPASSCQFLTNDQGQISVTTQVYAGDSETNTVVASALEENGTYVANATIDMNVSKTNAISIRYTDPTNTNSKLWGLIGGSDTPLTLDLALADSNVSGKSVVLYTNLGTISDTNGNLPKQSLTLTTDSNGEIDFNLQSDTAGTASLVAVYSPTGTSSLRVETEREFSFNATEAAEIIVEASPSTISFGSDSTITAIVKDSEGNLVRSREVIFHTSTDITGGKLKDAKPVLTDEYGRANTVYTAGYNATGENSSGTLGVQITASVLNSSGIIEISDVENVVVEPVNTTIVLGTGNTISEPTTTQFSKDFVVQVNDNGIPVPNSDVTVLVYPTDYAKGILFQADSDGDGEVDIWTSQGVDSLGNTLTTFARCSGEDANKNGVLDAGDETDTNNDGIVTPGFIPVSIVLDGNTSSGEITTNANGFGFFTLTYPQSHADWIDLEIEVRSAHNDGEAQDTLKFTPSLSAEQRKNMDASPANASSPFGREYYYKTYNGNVVQLGETNYDSAVTHIPESDEIDSLSCTNAR